MSIQVFYIKPILNTFGPRTVGYIRTNNFYLQSMCHRMLWKKVRKGLKKSMKELLTVGERKICCLEHQIKVKKHVASICVWITNHGGAVSIT